MYIRYSEGSDWLFQVEEGWWSGTMNGKSGLFPSNFVKEFETNEDEETNELTDETGNNGANGASLMFNQSMP